jgi:hypothetical protein
MTTIANQGLTEGGILGFGTEILCMLTLGLRCRASAALVM